MKGLFSFKILFTFIVFLFKEQGFAQCISIYPNTQNFEGSAAWTTGGVNNDWAWGTPSKSTINSAGGGNKCWITGGLNGASYAGGQQSYIESPCYNFSSLSAPLVSFKIFWETEFQYDGGSLQYSTNNGATWINVGSISDPANCANQKWFNHGNINYLSWSGSKQGWSGNSKPTSGSCMGGNGSLGWATAKHCLANLAGQNSVKFRFTFGSGTSCNNFDGLAIDDFTVEDFQSAALTFTNTCNSFTVIDQSCQTSSVYNWNFGDPSSGASNNAVGTSQVHFYSTAGIYSVSVSTPSGVCGGGTVFSKTISILGSAISGISNVTCKGGNNGSATVTAISGGSGLTYTWSPEGGNTNVANSLPAGNYSVTIQDANGCKSTSSVTINEPNSSTGSSSQTVTSCSGDAVTFQVNTTGISDPITYLWMPGGYTTNSITVSPTVSTTFTVTLNISGNCASTEQKYYTNIVSPKPLVAVSNFSNAGCAPFCLNLTDKSSTSVGDITSWNWSTSNSLNSEEKNPTFCFNTPGVYSIHHGVTSSIGCNNLVYNITTVTVHPTPSVEFSADKFVTTENDPVIHFQNTSDKNLEFEWSFGEGTTLSTTNPVFDFNAIGNYPVLLKGTNEFGCANTVMHLVKVEPEFTFFAPNSFTPNNDNLNDVFLPKGMAWDVTSYNLTIFDRWGRQVFTTNDYTIGWNGMHNNTAELMPNDVYVWKVSMYDLHRKSHQFSGSVLLTH